MAYNKPAVAAQRKAHKRYGSRVVPTPAIGGIVASACIVKSPPCPYIRVLCRIYKGGRHKKEDPGSVRCLVHAPNWGGRLNETGAARCYFYREWRRTGTVFL